MRTIICLIFMLTAILVGCSSFLKADKIEKSDSAPKNNPGSILEPKTERDISWETMKFPVSDDIDLTSTRYNASLMYLYFDICTYRRVSGIFPESMSSFVKSGYPLFWPRNVWDGTPISVIKRPLNQDKSDLGFVTWEKIDDLKGKLSWVRLDWTAYREKGIENWFVQTKETTFFPYLDRIKNDESLDLDTRKRIERDRGAEGAITIMGGITPINLVTDPETRQIYAMCGDLTDELITRTRKFYKINDRFPQNISELLSPSPYREMKFLIIENYQKLSQLLSKRNADFMTGFDYKQNIQYAFLAIDDEVLISFCAKYGIGDGETKYSGDTNLGLHHACSMNDLDMSSPLISTENIGSIQIPDEITISINNIPLGE